MKNKENMTEVAKNLAEAYAAISAAAEISDAEGAEVLTEAIAQALPLIEKAMAVNLRCGRNYSE